MKPITVRGVTLGEGVPKVIVPVTGATREEIVNKGAEIAALPECELVEWRADFYEDLTDTEKRTATLRALRAALGEEKPLLFTVRTKKEGGEADLSPADYTAINLSVAADGSADLIDVELSVGEKEARENLDGIHAAGRLVVGSRHDFQATPPRQEIVDWLRMAQELGADIPKIAVMPRNTDDVLTVIGASAEMAERYADRPILTISMGARGLLSRVACDMTGSCMTFGAVGQASAPGQIAAGDLKQLLTMIHTASPA